LTNTLKTFFNQRKATSTSITQHHPSTRKEPMAKNFKILQEQVMARPGAKERQDKLRQETLAEYGLYQLRADAGVTQIQVAELLGITQPAVSKIEHAEDMRISTLRSYLESLGTVLHLEVELPSGNRVPLHLTS
jgi:DNA-binding XRE family transcriptional regulator